MRSHYRSIPRLASTHDSGLNFETLLLTLAIAFVTSYLFYARNPKTRARRHLTRLELAARMIDDFTLLGGASAWSLLEPSG